MRWLGLVRCWTNCGLLSSHTRRVLAAARRTVARAADAHHLNQIMSTTPFDDFKFSPITEHQVTIRKDFPVRLAESHT